MFTGILFFGASSSQAVHPHSAPKDLAKDAAAELIKHARDLVLASMGSGARITSTRSHFSVAKEKLDAGDPAAAAAAAYAAVRAVGAPTPAVTSDLRSGYEFLVAALAGEACGIDTRQASSIYEAATAELGRGSDIFASSWAALAESVKAAEPGPKECYGEVLRILHAPERALDLIEEA